MHLVVSTLDPSATGGVSRSITVTCVEGCRFVMASAVDNPKTPAPMMITVFGNDVWEDIVAREAAIRIVSGGFSVWSKITLQLSS